MRKLRFILLVMTMYLVSSCDAGEGPTASAVPTLEVSEFVRIGSVDGPPEQRFDGVGPVRIVRSRQEVLVSDARSRLIRVFSRDGVFLRSWGGRGEGPGEFNGAPVLAFARDTVLVFDESRLHVFDVSGELLDTRALQDLGLRRPMIANARSDGWTMETRLLTEAGRMAQVYHFAVDQRTTPNLFFQAELGPSLAGLLVPSLRSTFAGDRYFAVGGEAYEVMIASPGSRLDTISVAADVVPLPRDLEDQYRIRRLGICEGRADEASCRGNAQPEMEAITNLPRAAYVPFVGELRGSPDGLVLAQRADLDPSVFTTDDRTDWDLFSGEGELLARVRLPAGLRVRWFDRQEVWGFELDALDVPYLVGYKFEGL